MNLTVKPWGSEDLIFQGNGYAVKQILLKKQKRTSLHYHNIKHETIIVYSGELTVFLDDNSENPKTILLKPSETIAIAPKTIHRMSSETTDTIYFEAQSDHLDDVIRIEDDEGRS